MIISIRFESNLETYIKVARYLVQTYSWEGFDILYERVISAKDGPLNILFCENAKRIQGNSTLFSQEHKNIEERQNVGEETELDIHRHRAIIKTVRCFFLESRCVHIGLE